MKVNKVMMGSVLMVTLLCVSIFMVWVLPNRLGQESAIGLQTKSDRVVNGPKNVQASPEHQQAGDAPVNKDVTIGKDTNGDNSINNFQLKLVNRDVEEDEPQLQNSDTSKDVVDILDPDSSGLESVVGASVLYSHQEVVEQAVDQLALKHDAEAYDELWAAERTQQISELFSQHSSEGNELVVNDCRSTFCRIDIAHTDSKAEQAFISEMIARQQFNDDGEQGLYQRRVDSNGAIRTVFYSARDGHRLPISDLKTKH